MRLRALAWIIAALVWISAGALPLSAQSETANAEGIPILVYHRLGPTVSDSMTVTTRVFEEQLFRIRARGYTVVPAGQVLRYFRGEKPLPPRSVVITVDDGHRSVYTEMWPLVRRFGIPVTLFVYPSAISNADYALTWSQLEELNDSGLWDIESHTFWHPNFKREKQRLDPLAYGRFVTVQLARAKHDLEARLGIRVSLLAWPFGIYDEDLMRRAASLGYTAAFTLERRAARASDPLMALPRYLVTDADRGARFEHLLSDGGRPAPD